MALLVWLVSTLLLVSVFASPIKAYQLSPLRTNADGTFKILFMTDLHLGEGDDKDEDTAANIKAMVDLEAPDFVVLGGDIFSNYATTAPSPKPRAWVEARWNIAVRHLQGRVQWATIFGNHDFSELSPNQLSSLDASFPGCLTPAGSYGDYVLPVYNQDGTEVVSRLFMFNSGDTGVQEWQVDRYKNLSSSLAPSRVASFGFVHIPFFEAMEAYNYGQVRGSQRDTDGICCQTEPNTLFDTIVDQDEIKIVTFGHDHGNDFVALLDGVQLAYGKKTGVGSYNNLLSAGKLRVFGGRVYNLKLSVDPSAQEWGAELFSEPRSYTDSTTGITTNYRFSVNSWIRLTNGDCDEQLEVRDGAASQLLDTCCTGPVDIWLFVIIFVPVGVFLLILATVTVLLCIFWKKMACTRQCCCCKSKKDTQSDEVELSPQDEPTLDSPRTL